MSSGRLVKQEYEIYFGRKVFHGGHSHFGDRDSWNLLLPLSGLCRLSIRETRVMLEPATLYMIEPETVRRFSVLEEWECCWLHFKMEGRVHIHPEWPEPAPGVYAVALPESDFRKSCAIFEEIREVCSLRRHSWYLLAYCLIQELILRGNMCCCSAFDSGETKKVAALLDNLDDGMSIGEIAGKCALSRTGFFNKFRSTFGTTPARYREQQLMTRMQSYLEGTDLTIKEIARILKCENQFYLSTRFRKAFGISPSQYRKLHRGKQS